jgi:NAD-dependent deacetylase
VPTFRGEEGYWRVGSANYHPQQLATREAFQRLPREIWAWYLHRRGVCARAQPNAAHRAIAHELGPWSRALLVTQNVDGLHLRAGSPPERTFEIHGNLDRMRCLAGCAGVVPLPAPALEASVAAEPAAALSAELASVLSCPGCGGWMRPHVLFFDETYDEPLFRFDSSMAAAASAALLLVVGTTGATNLPLHMGSLAWRAGATLIVVNPEPNPFSQLALRADHGLFLRGRAGAWVPLLTGLLRALSA